MKHSLMPGGACALAVMLMLSVAAATRAQGRRANDASRHAEAASRTFNQIMGTPDKGVPKELLEKAEAIAVFPGVKKAAFGIGGRGGQGVISRRTSSGWSAPAFYNLAGGSFGAQIGAESTDYVLLIMNDSGLNGLMKDKFEMGGEVGVAAGPVGREASAATDAQLKAGILTYSRSKGLFIGAALKGTAITPDNDLNQAFYAMKANEVLSGAVKETPAAVSIFPKTLASYSSK